MNLKRQIMLSFLFVALIPLLIVNVYLFWSNTHLAFNLYQQNLHNSSSIHTDIIKEHINRMMVRAQNLASTLEKSGALRPVPRQTLLQNPTAAGGILKFTDETLDSILVFTLLNAAGDVVYSSGSNSDTRQVRDGAAALPVRDAQYVDEIALGGDSCQIAIITPVRPGGRLIAIYRNDFFLKAISSHVQIESSNAFFYCRAHARLVAAKKAVHTETFGASAGYGEDGRPACRINGEPVEAYFQNISKTPWVLVNYIPFRQVYSHVFRNMALAGMVFLACLVVVVLLSRRQSARILHPMNRLLRMVERFFRTGKADFSPARVGGKTEIGYLAETFRDMAADMAAAQATLRESNYLYEAILHSSYEAVITIDYRRNHISTSLDQTDFPRGEDADAPRSVLEYFRARGLDQAEWDKELLERMIYGRMDAPVEGDVGLRASGGEERWYRIVAVPIAGMERSPRKTVLHLQNITARKKEELALQRSAQRDPLCGLLNKNTLLELAAQRRQTGHESAAMFFVDLDNFKRVNDSLGHAAGDEVLVETAAILKSAFRATDFICRYGGDEFIVFAPDMSRDTARDKAEHLVRTLKFRKKMPDGERIAVSASVGVWVSAEKERTELMIQRADQAMYKAKQQGKNQYFLTGGKESECGPKDAPGTAA